MNQTAKINKLKQASNQKDFDSQRALAQYIGVTSRPDLCAPSQLIASGNTSSSDEDFAALNKATNFLKETSQIELKFVHTKLESAKIILATEASFENARGLKSQLGFVLMICDKEGRANIVHYGSSRCKRVTSSVMAAEVHALILGFDQAFVLRDQLSEMIGRHIEISAYVDSKTIFDTVAKDGTTTEKRLLIDIWALRESYVKVELNRISWMPGK